MKKIVHDYGISLGALILIFCVVVFISYSKNHKMFHSLIKEQVLHAQATSSRLDVLMERKNKFINYDLFVKQGSILKKDRESIIAKINESDYEIFRKEDLARLSKKFDRKLELAEEFKSYNSMILNIFHFLYDVRQTIKKSNPGKKKLDKTTEDLLFSARQHTNRSEIAWDIKKDLKKLNRYRQQEVILFKKLIERTLELSNRLDTIHRQNRDLGLSQSLNKLAQGIDEHSREIDRVHTIVSYVLTAIILFFFILLTLLSRNRKKLMEELSSFKQAVENSDNSVVITNKNREITYINKTFEATTGYSFQEINGENPRVLQSGLMSQEFYSEMNRVLDRGEKWQGEFINKTKNGLIYYEQASITPIFRDGELNSFLAIKLDITNLKEKQKELEILNKQLENRINKEVEASRKKDAILHQQSKMAAMGEMIGNIAHQWRQPLNKIGLNIQDLSDAFEYKELNEKYLHDFVEQNMAHIQYMSQTIDDFRNFYSPNKEKRPFSIQKTIKDVISLIGATLKHNFIELEIEVEDVTINGYPNEFKQVLVNILNNAKDAINKQIEEDKYHKGLIRLIGYGLEKSGVQIEIYDNGGGINEEIIDRVFDPYFTTKFQSQGTGLGLYMSKQIIETNMGGSLSVKNTQEGVLFTINIPTDFTDKK